MPFAAEVFQDVVLANSAGCVRCVHHRWPRASICLTHFNEVKSPTRREWRPDRLTIVPEAVNPISEPYGTIVTPRMKRFVGTNPNRRAYKPTEHGFASGATGHGTGRGSGGRVQDLD